jgi:hypothetical protein
LPGFAEQRDLSVGIEIYSGASSDAMKPFREIDSFAPLGRGPQAALSTPRGGLPVASLR